MSEAKYSRLLAKPMFTMRSTLFCMRPRDVWNSDPLAWSRSLFPSVLAYRKSTSVLRRRLPYAIWLGSANSNKGDLLPGVTRRKSFLVADNYCFVRLTSSPHGPPPPPSPPPFFFWPSISSNGKREKSLLGANARHALAELARCGGFCCSHACVCGCFYCQKQQASKRLHTDIH